ncbi:MAG: molybdopterin-dependent oxidoreductase [Acidobacteria bacterium]|nr:molybdopterin-dependent oxidoreductase [Acidobacteriota bacterium]
MRHKPFIPGRRLDRRTFLKASGVLGAAGAGLLPGASTVRAAETEIAAGEEIRRSICDMCCIGRCGIEVLVKEGRATRVQPFRDYPRGPICVKGQSILLQLYHPDRLQYPMKRTNPKGSARAAWQRISWDEALDTIAERLDGIRRKYGAEKVLFYAGDPKDAVRPNLQRLALKFGSPNYGTESSVCHRATVLATSLNGAGSAGLTPDTRAVILWAQNPAWAMACEMERLVQAKERGVKIIDVDPRLAPTTKLADIHLQLRPGTDGALALGMARVIINEGLYDEDFVRDWTRGFEDFRDYVQQFTPEKVETITGVAAGKLVAAARMYASNLPTGWITSAASTVHHWNGCQNHRAISAMTALTGTVAVPGMEPSIPPLSFRDITDWKTLLPPLRDKRADLKDFPVWEQFVQEIQVNRLPEYVGEGTLRAGLFVGCNYRMWPQDHLYSKAIRDMEFAAGADFWLTPTMELMDIALPAATSLERLGPIAIAERTVFLPQPVVRPIGEARGDMEWMWDLAKHMGMGADFWNGDILATLDWQLEPLGIQAADLMKEPKGMVIPPGKPQSGKPGFKTPSGKFELKSAVLEKAGFDGLPVYREPPEGPVAAPQMAGKYPLIFNTGSREPMYTHSRHRNNPRLRELQPDPKVDIHPIDARARGIQQGEDAVVETSAGGITVKANITHLAQPGVVHVYHGWPQADVNTITARTLDPISGFPAFKSQLCQVRKA